MGSPSARIGVPFTTISPAPVASCIILSISWSFSRARTAAEIEPDDLGIDEEIACPPLESVATLFKNVTVFGDREALSRPLLDHQDRNTEGVHVFHHLEHLVLHFRRQARRRSSPARSLKAPGSTRALAEAPAPVRRWHRVQWQ